MSNVGYACIAALALTGCAPSGPPAAVVAKGVQQRVASLEGSAAIGGEPLLERKTVARFYQSRQSRPAWDRGDAPAIVEAIRGVEQDGLEPRDYHLQAIETEVSLAVSRFRTDSRGIQRERLPRRRVHRKTNDRRAHVRRTDRKLD